MSCLRRAMQRGIFKLQVRTGYNFRIQGLVPSHDLYLLILPHFKPLFFIFVLVLFSGKLPFLSVCVYVYELFLNPIHTESHDHLMC